MSGRQNGHQISILKEIYTQRDGLWGIQLSFGLSVNLSYRSTATTTCFVDRIYARTSGNGVRNEEARPCHTAGFTLVRSLDRLSRLGGFGNSYS